MRVAVYAIALNEAGHVEPFLRMCHGADCVIVADTGSTDGTPERLRSGGAITHSITVRPWRFDDARNAALALVPPDIDVCLALDLDETLSREWRNALERGWRHETTLGRYRYVTAHLPDGAPAVVMSGAKIHRRFGYRWHHICHELLIADRLARPVETWLPDLQVDHWPDLSKSRTNYLSLLEAAVAESPSDPRDLFLLARDYVGLRRWQDAETMLRRYLKAVGDRWPLQRAAALRRLAKCHRACGDVEAAMADLQEALRLAPKMRDLWLDFADLHAELEAWEKSYEAASRGLALPIVPGSIANDYANAGGRPFYRASLVAWRLGRLDEARMLAIQANTREPGHKLFQKHVRELAAL